MFFMASSAAAEQIVSDEGIPVFYTGVSDTGRVSLVTLLCTSKESNSPIKGETNVSD